MKFKYINIDSKLNYQFISMTYLSNLYEFNGV